MTDAETIEAIKILLHVVEENKSSGTKVSFELVEEAKKKMLSLIQKW